MMLSKINDFLIKMMIRKEEGQGLVEYALIILLIAIVVLAVLFLLGEEVRDVFQRIVDTFQDY